jgi:hypothetical protein
MDQDIQSAEEIFGTPCVLSAAVEIPETTTGNRTPVVIPDVERLQVPFDVGGFWLDEILIQTTEQNSDPADPASTHAKLFVRLTLDGKEITRDFVPAWLFAPVQDVLVEHMSNATDWFTAGDTGITNTAIRWRLPKPLFLKPGQTLIPQFQGRSPDDNAGVFVLDPGCLVDIGYLGRTVPIGTPLPSKVCLPYVSHAGLVQPTSGQAASQIFTEEFRNWFSTDLYVQRFVMRHGVASGQVGDQTEIDEYATGSAFALASLPYTDSVMSVDILAPNGFKCLENYPQAVEAFWHSRHHWTHGTILKPGATFRITLAQTATLTSFQDVNGVARAISMVGYREEVLS